MRIPTSWGFYRQFHLSLSLSVVPSCFKKSTIVPIPKKNLIKCLNDWRPVALTPIFSKCFERLISDHICYVLPAGPLQFAYRSNRSTNDAIAFILHTALSSHLENKKTYMCHESRPGDDPSHHQRSPPPIFLDSITLTLHTCHFSHSQLFPITMD